MKVVVFAVVLAIAFAVPAAAQQPQNTNTPVTAPTRMFSKASIDRAVASAASSAPTTLSKAAPATPAKHQTQKKNFFKTPWPYIIGGGVAAIILIAAYSGDSSTPGGPY